MEYFVLGWGNSFFFGVVFLGCEHIFSLGRNIFEEGVDNGVDSSYNISCDYGMWHSLVARIVRDDEAAGSNPVIPTIYKKSETSPIGLVFFVRRAPCCNPILMIECIPVNAIEGVVES